MNRTANVVIGANYGDEGKGLMTDYHVAPAGAQGIVVRFNGGAQAGHTVTSPNGIRHVFSHLGSGTLAGAATFLSRHFVCNPVMFFKEVDRLHSAGIESLPPVFVDGRAPVTTPYDVLINQIVERARGQGRHGSCGMGFGETIARSLEPEFTLTAGDLDKGSGFVLHRLNAIREEWVPRRLAQLGIAAVDDEARDRLDSDAVMEHFTNLAMRFRRGTVRARPDVLSRYACVVFEGAQGLLLDQDRGAFPYVTRSNTGIRNALEVATEAGVTALAITYATRAYLTRHGAGPLANELPDKPYPGVHDATNIPNEFQGSLRFAHLDIDLLAQAIADDFADAQAAPGMTVTRNLSISCLDQVGQQVHYIENGQLASAAPLDFARHLGARVQAATVYTSVGPTRDTIAITVRGACAPTTPTALRRAA